MEKKTKRLGVLGGTFSPIHRGHIHLAEYARDHCRLDKVLLIPAGIPPHKQGMEIADAGHRLEMTRLAAEGRPKLEVSSMEIDTPGVSYTYDTLCRLQKLYGEDWEIFFITGTDELLGLQGWYRAKEMLTEFGFLIGVRPGYEMNRLQERVDALRKEFGARIEILFPSAPDISASQVRKCLEGGLPAEELLDERVVTYIEKMGLYK